MKKIIFTVSLFFILINTFCFVKTNDEKNKVLYLFSFYSSAIEYEIINNGVISYLLDIQLSKDLIDYKIIENKSEKFIFSLTSSYFSYFTNSSTYISGTYLITFE